MRSLYGNNDYIIQEYEMTYIQLSVFDEHLLIINVTFSLSQ